MHFPLFVPEAYCNIIVGHRQVSLRVSHFWLMALWIPLQLTYDNIFSADVGMDSSCYCYKSCVIIEKKVFSPSLWSSILSVLAWSDGLLLCWYVYFNRIKNCQRDFLLVILIIRCNLPLFWSNLFLSWLKLIATKFSCDVLPFLSPIRLCRKMSKHEWLLDV